MEIIRDKHESHFTIVANAVMRDHRLSFRARGIHHFLLSFPSGWRIDSNSIAAAGKEGRDAVRSALRELEDCGYLRRIKERDEQGRWVTRTYVSESPLETESPEPENPAPENPAVGEPAVGDIGPLRRTEKKTVMKDLSAVPATRSTADMIASEWWENYKRATGGKTPTGKRAWHALRAVTSGALDAGWSEAEVRRALSECSTIPTLAHLDRMLTRSGGKTSAGEDRLKRDLEFLATVVKASEGASPRSLSDGDR